MGQYATCGANFRIHTNSRFCTKFDPSHDESTTLPRLIVTVSSLKYGIKQKAEFS